MQTTTEPRCPTCGTSLPMTHGFVTWCHSCGWNLSAPEPATDGGRMGAAYAAVGRRLARRMARHLAKAETLEPRITPSKVIAYAIAVATHGVTIGFAISGIALAAVAFPNPFAIGAGILLVGIAVLMRPRLGRVPKEDVVDRSAAPTLHAFIDEVSAALGVQPADVLVVGCDYNASWASVGLRRRRVLTVGLPLLTVLDPDERVALVAHEVAHARNGDPTRGILVGSAVDGLAELYGLFEPRDGGWDLGVVDAVARVLQYTLSRPVLALLLVELHLLLRDMQRAEYLADALASEVAGTTAMISLHEKTLLGTTVEGVLKRLAKAGGEHVDVFSELEQALARIPERERDRRRRVARLEDVRLSDTHPPTAMRIELLEQRPRRSPAVVLEAERSRRIDQELATLRPAFADKLLEEYREALYA